MPAEAELGSLTWPEVTVRAAGSILAVPLGSTEQHGPHLPLSTDTVVAVELCRRLAHACPDVLVAPALPYGSSGEHAGFAGTLSIGRPALVSLVIELVRSADAFAGVVLVSAHGGNAAPLRTAVGRLVGEGRRVMAWSPTTSDPSDSHAGHGETSVMLVLDPDAVRGDRAQAGATRPLGELMAEMRRGGMAAVSANGVLGDPSGATASAGTALLDRWAAELAETVLGWP